MTKTDPICLLIVTVLIINCQEVVRTFQQVTNHTYQPLIYMKDTELKSNQNDIFDLLLYI